MREIGSSDLCLITPPKTLLSIMGCRPDSFLENLADPADIPQTRQGACHHHASTKFLKRAPVVQLWRRCWTALHDQCACNSSSCIKAACESWSASRMLGPDKESERPP